MTELLALFWGQNRGLQAMGVKLWTRPDEAMKQDAAFSYDRPPLIPLLSESPALS